MKFTTLEELKQALADAMRPSDCPCATPLDRANTILALREIRKALAPVKSLG